MGRWLQPRLLPAQGRQVGAGCYSRVTEAVRNDVNAPEGQGHWGKDLEEAQAGALKACQGGQCSVRRRVLRAPDILCFAQEC